MHTYVRVINQLLYSGSYPSMQRSIKTVIVPLLVALIGAAGTVGTALLGTQTDKSPSRVTPSPTSTHIAANGSAKSECNQAVASKVCVANVTVQINSDEPQLVAFSQRIPLKTGDNLRVVNLHYCICVFLGFAKHYEVVGVSAYLPLTAVLSSVVIFNSEVFFHSMQ